MLKMLEFEFKILSKFKVFLRCSRTGSARILFRRYKFGIKIKKVVEMLKTLFSLVLLFKSKNYFFY